MDDKRWIELAKRKKQDKYFGFISLLIVIMMVFFTVKKHRLATHFYCGGGYSLFLD